jgi:hypothetical protein
MRHLHRVTTQSCIPASHAGAQSTAPNAFATECNAVRRGDELPTPVTGDLIPHVNRGYGARQQRATVTGFTFADIWEVPRQGRMQADWSACRPNQETVFADFPAVSERSGPR